MWYKCIMERWKIDLKFAPRKWNSNTHFTLTVNKIPNTMPTSISQPFHFLKSQRLNVAKLSASLYFLLILRYLPSVMGNCEASLDVEATRHALRYTVPAILVLDAWWPSVNIHDVGSFPFFAFVPQKMVSLVHHLRVVILLCHPLWAIVPIPMQLPYTINGTYPNHGGNFGQKFRQKNINQIEIG